MPKILGSKIECENGNEYKFNSEPPPAPDPIFMKEILCNNLITLEHRSIIAQCTFQKCLELLEKKGRSYSGSEDVNLNFKENARRLGMTKFQVWAVYANKHVDSINNAIKSNPELPVDHSESLEGRVIDMINYGICLLALLEEGK
jgi:hypothetical protein